MAVSSLSTRSIRRAVSRHRRLVAAVLVAAAVMTGLQALAPAPPPTEVVLTAARDVAAGAELVGADLTTARLPPEAVPAGALREPADAEGRRIAGPLRQGEPLTDVRLVGRGLLNGYGGGVVAAPVRIADPGAVRFLRTGDHVDVLAAAATESTTSSLPAVVAHDVPVVAVPEPGEDAVEGALVVLAVTSGTASVLTMASVRARLSVVVRP